MATGLQQPLGTAVFLPAYAGWGLAIVLALAVMLAWALFATWNEGTRRFTMV